VSILYTLCVVKVNYAWPYVPGCPPFD
jgi:putative lipase involved disintegration of autophagic bodies